MNYTRQVTDLDTGEKTWLDLGDHRPLTEVATGLGIGPRRFREALSHMGILHREWDDRSRQHRHRLTPGAVESGFGIRHDNKGFRHDPDRSPFDVLSPLGVEYVREHLSATLAALGQLPANVREALSALNVAEAARRTDMTPEMRVSWLADHHPDLGPAHVAQGLGISEALVHRYRSRREQQIRRAKQSAAIASSWWLLGEVTLAEQAATAAAGQYILAGVES